MESLLYEIYDGRYNINEYRDEEEEKIARKVAEMKKQVKAELGEEFMERLTDLYLDWMQMSDFRHYREGFSLGVRLVLEAFTSATG